VYWQVAFAAKADGGRIHHLEISLDDVKVGYVIKHGRRLVCVRIIGIYAVDFRCFQDRIRLDLQRSQRGRGVCGEVGVAGARREDNDPALLDVSDSAAADKW